MKTSSRGVALIKEFEGLETKAYRDIGGVLTIGYGHTGPDVQEYMVITAKEAGDLLERDLVRFEKCVSQGLDREALQNQFDAMVALAFNIGCSAFSTSTVLRRFNKGESPERVADAWIWWNRVDGKISPGLVRRRRAEIDLFLGIA